MVDPKTKRSIRPALRRPVDQPHPPIPSTTTTTKQILPSDVRDAVLSALTSPEAHPPPPFLRAHGPSP